MWEGEPEHLKYSGKMRLLAELPIGTCAPIPTAIGTTMGTGAHALKGTFNFSNKFGSMFLHIPVLARL